MTILAACSREQTSPAVSPGPDADVAAVAPAVATATAVPPPTRTATPLATPTPEPTPFVPGPVILPTVAIPRNTPTPEGTEPLSSILKPIGDKVAVLRRLFEVSPLQTTLITRDDLVARLRTELDEELEEIAQREALYIVLGIMDREASLLDLLLDLYGQQVVGFFDSEEEQLYVVSDGDRLSALDMVTYAHEFTHGLQQQHFDIRSMGESLENNSDQALAYRGVVEGDATLAESLYVFQHLSEEERADIVQEASTFDVSALQAAPHAIQREFIFPYQEGARFAFAMLSSPRAWQAVNELYEDIPQSTEQVLHPEKYVSGEAPIEVDVPNVASALGGEWGTIREDTLGEFLLLSYLEDQMSPEEAGVATTGWGGDTYVLFERQDGEILLQAVIEWDSDTDAQEFFDALVRFTSARTGAEWEPVEGDARAQTIESDGQIIFASLATSRTTLIFAPDTVSLEAALSASSDG